MEPASGRRKCVHIPRVKYMRLGFWKENKATIRTKAPIIIMKTIYGFVALVAAFSMSGCFGFGLDFAKRRKLRDPHGYEKERRENREWLENDAQKRGYQIPEYRPDEL